MVVPGVPGNHQVLSPIIISSCLHSCSLGAGWWCRGSWKIESACLPSYSPRVSLLVTWEPGRGAGVLGDRHLLSPIIISSRLQHRPETIQRPWEWFARLTHSLTHSIAMHPEALGDKCLLPAEHCLNTSPALLLPAVPVVGGMLWKVDVRRSCDEGCAPIHRRSQHSHPP